MNQRYRDARKIDPTQGAVLADAAADDQVRMEIGLTQLAFNEWADAGLVLPDPPSMRAYPHQRLVDVVKTRGFEGRAALRAQTNSKPCAARPPRATWLLLRRKKLPAQAYQIAICLRMTSGPFCMLSVAANRSSPGCPHCPPKRTHGFRNVAHGLS